MGFKVRVKAIAKSDSNTLKQVRDYISRNSLEPEVLRIIGEESVRNGMDKLTSRQIDQIIKEARMERRARSQGACLD